MIDTARLLTAVHLGLCATAALLLAAAFLAADIPRRALAAGAFFGAAAAATVATLLRAEAGAASALDGAWTLALLAAPLASAAVRARVASAPLAALLALPTLRLAGLDVLAAERAGWLPPRFAHTAAAVEGVAGLAAIAATALALRRGRAAAFALQAIGALSVVAAAATAILAHRGARPLPSFEALYVAGFLPLCTVAHAAAIASLRTPAQR